MKQIGIQNFTSPKSNKTIPVACGSIVTVLPYDTSLASGPAYAGANSLLVTNHGYFLPVTENFDTASKLWLDGMEGIAGVGNA